MGEKLGKPACCFSGKKDGNGKALSLKLLWGSENQAVAFTFQPLLGGNSKASQFFRVMK